MTINIIAGSGLNSNSAALAAFDRAAAQWSSVFSDNITVNINADLTSTGFSSSNIIGQTSEVRLQASYSTLRNALAASATGVGDTIDSYLPTAGQFNVALPSGFYYSGLLSATKANLKAIGFTGLDQQFGTSDATITFNSNFNFNYDNTQAFVGSQEDFETVAAHEIGHALGFISSVDTVDTSSSGAITPTLLDLFRLNSNGGVPTSGNPFTLTQFATATRDLTPGNPDYFFTSTTSAYLLSTGLHGGDGNQASHWKDDSISGNYIGIMDPTLAYNTIETVGTIDIQALNLIGYDVVTPEPATLGTFAFALAAMAWQIKRKK